MPISPFHFPSLLWMLIKWRIKIHVTESCVFPLNTTGKPRLIILHTYKTVMEDTSKHSISTTLTMKTLRVRIYALFSRQFIRWYTLFISIKLLLFNGWYCSIWKSSAKQIFELSSLDFISQFTEILFCTLLDNDWWLKLLSHSLLLLSVC